MTTAAWVPEHAEATGRIGLAARGAVYCLAGLLALAVATGRGSGEIEGQGAVESLAGKPFGGALLVALAIGLVAYALWRLLRAITGAGEGADRDGWQEAVMRAGNAAQAIVYVSLAMAAVRVLRQGSNGSEGGSDQRARSITARLLEQGWGRAAVIAVGLGLVAAGAGMVWWGVSRRFEEHLRTSEMTAGQREWLPRLGVFGHAARGVVAALVGLFLVQAALDHDPSEAVGIDGALRRLADQTYGPVALVVVALGLVAYGLYSFVEARWRKVLE